MLLLGAALGCGKNEAQLPHTVTIRPGPNVQEEAQTALIKAQPGDTIEFGPGTFEFTRSLSLAVPHVTVRGKGMDETTLSFLKQDTGTEGLLVTRDHFTLEDLTIEDAKGDGIKINGADDVILRRVRARWTGGEKESNGAYGLYPVQCKDVLIEECSAYAASDAGIYVGQSQKVIVRKCRAERNVAGIEIENCIDADVSENVCTNNAGGLLVFDLPGLQVKNGKRVRVFENQVFANNHDNFAPKGNTVAMVAPGTGMMVMATDQVEVFKNTIKDNQTNNLVILSYKMTGLPIEDKDYDPYPEGVFVHDNLFAGGGTNPGGPFGQTLVALLGKPVPDILYDGIQNPAKRINGQLPAGMGIYLKDNGSATFANLHWDKLNEKNPLTWMRIERQSKPYEGEMPSLSPVVLTGTP
jgi:parallel beta-helix repeat protein